MLVEWIALVGPRLESVGTLCLRSRGGVWSVPQIRQREATRPVPVDPRVMTLRSTRPKTS